MMPHPEAYLFPENHPTWDFDIKNNDLPKYGLGILFFDNAVKYINRLVVMEDIRNKVFDKERFEY